MSNPAPDHAETPSLGRTIRDLREAQSLTRSKLAADADVSYAYVRQLETGERTTPRAEHLARIAQALGVTVDQLLHGRVEGVAPPTVHDERQRLRVEIDTILAGLSDGALMLAADFLKTLERSTHLSHSNS